MERLTRTGRAVLLVVATLVVGLVVVVATGVTKSPPSRTDAAGTVWLCRPGIAANPCTTNTVIEQLAANGSMRNYAPSPAPGKVGPKTDCFYVYPTVSPQPTPNSDLTIDPAQTNVAQIQAAMFSLDCQIWAPMYTQITIAGLNDLTHFQDADAMAYASILQGWQDYIKNFNKGRPIIFIGHSQGSAMLIKLLQTQVDPNPKVRKLLVSALLMGGNVTVKDGSDRGGSFKNIPACGKPKQFGCVLAYSSFLTTPPANSLFGFPGQGVSFLSGSLAKDGLHVLCTNPAGLGARPGALIPLFPGGSGGAGHTTYPGLYTGQCSTDGGANVLHVTPAGAGDPRPLVTESLGATWGLHLFDVNIAQGNLITDAGVEAKAWWDAWTKANKKKTTKHHR